VDNVIQVRLGNGTFTHDKRKIQISGPRRLHIMTVDITKWTNLCYEAKKANHLDDIAEAFRAFTQEAYQKELVTRINPTRPDKWPLERENESSTITNATVNIANHTGDGFIVLSSNAEKTIFFAQHLRDCAFPVLIDALKSNGISLADGIELRLAIHCGDVWKISGCNPKPAEEDFGTDSFYFSEAINLVSRLVTSSFCRKAGTRAICTEEFRKCLPEKWCNLFGPAHVLCGSKDGEECDIDYPTNVQVHAIFGQAP
jgi:hypothetical protein